LQISSEVLGHNLHENGTNLHDTPEWEYTLKVEVPWVFSFFGINVQITNIFEVELVLYY